MDSLKNRKNFSRNGIDFHIEKTDDGYEITDRGNNALVSSIPTEYENDPKILPLLIDTYFCGYSARCVDEMKEETLLQ